MDVVYAIVDLIKGIAWPSAIIAIALMFKKEIPGLFNRLQEIGLQGAKFSPIESQQDTKDAYPSSSHEVNLTIKTVNASPAGQLIEAEIQNELDRLAPESRQGVLLSSLVQARLQAAHERVYRIIFGSQIRFLRELNVAGIVPQANVKNYFNEQTTAFKEIYKTYGFDGWFNFLRANLLINEKADNVEISVFGQDFLLYLTTHQISENKPY